jgi:nascent polypeptide-associated complex subunit alpha
MIPGGMRNQRQMELAMRRLGMTTEPVENVEEVVIRTRDTEHVLAAPEVTILTVQGVRTYQVVGTAVVRPRTAGAISGGGPSAAPPVAPPAGPPEEDVRLVMEQANVGHEEAIDALTEADGQPAEAILQLLSRRGPGGG